MECRKLLDAQVFNGWQKLLKQLLQTVFSVDFWEFCFFSHFYTYLELKSIHFPTSFSRKNDSQFDRKKELEAIREEREYFFVCCILDIDYSLNSIVHWIAWTHSTHMQWYGRLFNKWKILAHDCLKILTIFLY